MDASGPPGRETYEAALLECAAGRNNAIAKIYAAESDRLKAVARRIVLQRDRAEDVIHDAFLQILRDAKDFDPARGSARGWIYAIVRNTALKSRKHAGREPAADQEEISTAIDRDSADRQTKLVEGFDLRASLESLEPRRRACLIMAIVDGRTHVEIAAYLGVPVGTVKSWIRRELIALREQLR